MWLTEYDSPSFTFRAFGTTKREAEGAMINGLNHHGKDCGLPVNWYDVDSINTYEFHAGWVRRDDTLILPKYEADRGE